MSASALQANKHRMSHPPMKKQRRSYLLLPNRLEQPPQQPIMKIFRRQTTPLRVQTRHQSLTLPQPPLPPPRCTPRPPRHQMTHRDRCRSLFRPQRILKPRRLWLGRNMNSESFATLSRMILSHQSKSGTATCAFGLSPWISSLREPNDYFFRLQTRS